jgi:pimeloyl-ACP methyl ester carboxylesterase
MGAHTALRFALEQPERVGAVVVITPAYEPAELDDPARLARWDALAAGLRDGGVEGFVAAYGEPGVPDRYRDTVLTVLRQRLSAHEHPRRSRTRSRSSRARARSRTSRAAQASRCRRSSSRTATRPTPATRWPWGRHTRGRSPARARRGGEGRSPIAWQGGQLSKVIAGLAAEGRG